MSIRKRRKSSRYPGTRTHGRGRKNRTRGLGNRGGKGLSGTGKRGDQKKTKIIEIYGNDYFGKDQRGKGLQKRRKTPSVSLKALARGFHGLIKKGVAKQVGNTYELHLEMQKIIGNTVPVHALTIYAKAASESAIAAVKKAGGEIKLTTSESS
jgi:large subunit ribosomal protein L15